ncbi:MAG TPA: hypothetical protein PKM48_06945 [Parvularculaceae bacterium]|nr:hypothetical protein [Parvularculaceae bacterium]
MTNLFRAIIAAALTFGVAACATQGGGLVSDGPGWTAHGYLTPGPTSEPEIIGTYATERECRDAVDGWMSRQVVGNPVFGECLPVDRR